MPTIREINLEKAKAQRIERLELSRRFGASLGVEGARRYNSQKRQQEQAALSDIKATLTQQRQEESQQRALMAAEHSLRRGEGIRSAMELAESLAAKAHVESSAWKAEKKLELARYNVARQSAMVPHNLKASASAMAAANREKAKSMELERSTKLLTRSKSSLPFTSLAVPLESPIAAVIAAPTPVHSTAEVTAKYDAKRREELAAKAQTLKEDQQKTRERAKMVLQEKHSAEELDRIEKENEMMLKKSMMEHAMRSIRPMASHDFQEQDARKSMQLANQAQKEFEAVFLNGPWSIDSIKKYHVPPPSEDSHDTDNDFMDGIEGFEVFQSATVEDLLKGTPSIGLPVSELFAKIVLPIEEEGEVGDEEPIPHEDAPIPIHNETNITQMSGHSATISNSLPPLPPPRHEVSITAADEGIAGAGEGSDGTDHLAERNKQFLQQLAVLQRRLANAKSITAPLHNSTLDTSESETSQDASASDDSVSLSPMSTPERSHHRPNTTRLAMTTDQLRNAIRNMKLSNKHINTSDSEDTQSSAAL